MSHHEFNHIQHSDSDGVSNNSWDFPHQTPLTPAQQGILVGQQLDPDSPLYNMGMLYHIHGGLDSNRFIKAWDATVVAADALRIRLHLSDGEATQFEGSQPVRTNELDFSNAMSPLVEGKAWIQADLEKPMSLSGALVESTLIKLDANEWLWYCKQHHIITDATSFAAIWNQINTFYSDTTTATGRTVGRKYLDYVQQQIETISAGNDKQSSTDRDNNTQYWIDKTLPPSPRMYGRKSTLTNTFATRDELFIETEKATNLESMLQLSDIRSFSPHLARFQILLTVFFAYLYRVSGQTSLTIATTAPNRSDQQFAMTPGLFVEQLPLTVDVDANDTFGSLLAKVKTEVMAFMKNTQPGVGQFVKNRDISAVLNYIPLTIEPLAGMPVTTHWLHSGHMDRQHAICLHAMDWNNAGKLSLAFDTNDSCFTPAQKNSAQHHWMALFDAFIVDRSQAINEVDITYNDPNHKSTLHSVIPYQSSVVQKTSTQEHENDLSSTSVVSIIERFESTAKQHAQEIALEQDTRHITFTDLSIRVDLIAQAIQYSGIGLGNNVAILLPRSMSVPVALLGVLKSGATFVPIESNNPPERIRQLLQDAEVRLVISTNNCVEKLESDTNAIILDDEGRITKSAGEKSAEHRSTTSFDIPELDALAYILYTSGSTGSPKGVAISHAALMNYSYWAVDFYTGGERLAFPFFTPFSFDLTITSLLVPLLSGGVIHVYSNLSDTIDNSILEVIKDDKVDIIKLTPAHLAMLQQTDPVNSRVRQLVVGGEDLKCNLAQNTHNMFGGCVTIHNEYGPTEATVGCVVHTFDPVCDVTGSVPIGLPVAGMSAHLLNDALQEQPAGVAGTLYLSGPSLANGYWKNKQLTDASFLRLENDEAKRFYCTGDLARFNEQGKFVYMGRQDDQQKIRGARIELAEIESIALQKANLKNCVVKPIQILDNTNAADIEQRLALYYTADDSISAATVKQYLASALPSWMIPDWFIQLDVIPINRNGKVDRSALPKPVGQRDLASVEYVAASTDVEKKLVEIWCEQLKIEKIGIHDNFFELGGDSLSAIRITAKINKCGLKISSAELLERQTISELAQACSEPKAITSSTDNEEVQLDPPKAFSSLNSSQLDKLAGLLDKSV